MATKEQIEDVIFNGGLPSDAEMSEDDNPSDDFNGFDEDADSEENDEESMQEDDDSEDSEPAPRKNKKESVAELLRQQVAQNNLLMQRLAGNAPQPSYSEEDRKALEEGRALLNMQRNNPALYNKVSNFVATELQGGQTQNQINGKLSALKQMLKSDKYKELDSTPFNEVIEAMELVDNNTKKENQQLLQVITNLQRDMQGIKADKESIERQKIADRDDLAMIALKKAEYEFGIKLVKGSEEAEDFVLLVKNGKNPRTAFMKANGLKETDVVKRSKVQKTVDLNPKVAVKPVSGASSLARKLFPETRSTAIFKKK